MKSSSDEEVRRISGGVTAARGFLAHGVRSGLKRKGPDLALILSEVPAAAAGVLTTHRLAAPPVRITRGALRAGRAQAILANSGNANCCTGPAGERDALSVRQAAAEALELPASAVLIASTGVIGKRLAAGRILRALPALIRGLNRSGSSRAARAILTTDLTTKSEAVEVRVQGRQVRVGGIAKGSGMIDPAMATMLCFITTDAVIAPPMLRRTLRRINEETFNAITVDGQMSTNDTVLVLANGLAGHARPLKPGVPGWEAFSDALRRVMSRLARQIVRDGEGATRLLTVRVDSARTRREALHLAKAIANAPLVKTMVRGRDPNWGRVAATVGAAGVPLREDRIEIFLSGVPVFRRGAPVRADGRTLKTRFSRPHVSIEIALHAGSAGAAVETCDLSEGYVRINAKYN